MSTGLRSLLTGTTILLGLSACGAGSAPETAAPLSAPSAPGAAATTSAAAPAPGGTAGGGTAGGGAAGGGAAGGAPATSRAERTDAPARTAKCPSARALEKLVDLPEDWYFIPSSVTCWRNWATADPEGPTPGDGIYLFKYQSGSGWRFHSQGSDYHCADLGITGPAPFCY